MDFFIVVQCWRTLTPFFKLEYLFLIELIAKLWQLIQPDPQGLAISSVGPGRLALFFSFVSLGGASPPNEKKTEKFVTACQGNSISTSISISISIRFRFRFDFDFDSDLEI